MDASADAVPGRLVSWSAEAAANPAEKRSAAPISWAAESGSTGLVALAYPFNRSSRCAGWSSCRSALSGVHGWTPGMVPHRFGLRGATEHSWLPAEPGAPAGRTTLASLRPALLLLNG